MDKEFPQPPMSPTNRKRMSPHVTSSSTSISNHGGPNNFARSKVSMMHPSNPPKLKENPRDRPRRLDSERSTSSRKFPMHDPCHSIQMFDPESDWSAASLNLSRGLNSIWNCGADVNNNSGGGASTNHTTMMGGGGGGAYNDMNNAVQHEGRNETSQSYHRDHSARDAMTGVTSERMGVPNFDRKDVIAA
mmetsp:Transcript_9584/g.14862  ORF Transcript_9584/g.14862 Transcript_9584/m.14862 type:complete len:190 (-) Transcript_9584:274-843(-)